jgi:prolipoprotein diacylglyceryltransferase
LIDLAIAALLIWIVLYVSRLAWYRAGDALAIYCILYGIGRFVIERDRTDSLFIGPLPAAYWLSGGLVLFGGAMLALRHVRKPDAVVEASAQ